MYEADKIVDSAEYGQHIALTCVNHPDKRWSTKNIAPLGCRTIFYNLHGVRDMGEECDCSARDLRAVE
jgi:hypothetical protein